ncbi:hypothetical protein KR018_003816, partial [Drosophila ironensis]
RMHPGCIDRIWFEPLPKDSKWVNPLRVNYIENNKKKFTDLIQVGDGVVVVLFNKSSQKLVFVRQFRGAVYQGIYMSGRFDTKVPKGDADLKKFPPELGITMELCGGSVDKNMSLADIAREEVLEECGYKVPVESLQRIFDYRGGIGTSSGAMTLFYCEVCDEQKVASGGGVETEDIEVVELPIEEARKLITPGVVTNGGPTCMLGILWFYLYKAPQILK